MNPSEMQSQMRDVVCRNALSVTLHHLS